MTEEPIEVQSEATIWQDFARPFTDDELDWRVQRCGKSGKGVWAILVPYLQARPVMDRLDEAIGPENWKDEYKPIHFAGEEGFTCRLSLKIDGEWVYREDGAPLSKVEPIKGGHSDAFKRAAVKVGMGRYLYGFPVVFARDITTERPKDSRQWVSIESKSEGIKAWCPSPCQSDIGQATPPPMTEQQPQGGGSGSSSPTTSGGSGPDAIWQWGEKEKGKKTSEVSDGFLNWVVNSGKVAPTKPLYGAAKAELARRAQPPSDNKKDPPATSQAENQPPPTSVEDCTAVEGKLIEAGIMTYDQVPDIREKYAGNADLSKASHIARQQYASQLEEMIPKEVIDER